VRRLFRRGKRLQNGGVLDFFSMSD
jgi:hypothetical protein